MLATVAEVLDSEMPHPILLADVQEEIEAIDAAITAQPRTDAAQQGEVACWRMRWTNAVTGEWADATPWQDGAPGDYELRIAERVSPNGKIRYRIEYAYTAPPSAPVVDRDRIGQAISDHLCGLAEDGTLTLDAFDSNNIDAIVDAVVPALAQQPAAVDEFAGIRARLLHGFMLDCGVIGAKEAGVNLAREIKEVLAGQQPENSRDR